MQGVNREVSGLALRKVAVERNICMLRRKGSVPCVEQEGSLG